MVKSYEVIFEGVSEVRPAKILARSFYREGREYKIDIKRSKEKTIVKITVAGKNGNEVKFKRILISNEFKSECGEDTAIIIDYPGKC